MDKDKANITSHPAESDDCRSDYQMYAEIRAKGETHECPYCGETMSEERAKAGCCGEVHCIEIESKEWDEFMAQGETK